MANLFEKREDMQAFKASLKERVVSDVDFAGLVVIHDFMGRRSPTAPSVDWISGETEKVKDFVADRLQKDTCTPQYAHMLWMIAEVHESGDGTHLSIKMTKSNYAGD